MARIGLLSDSHGRAATTRRAVRLLIARGAEVLLHLGDVESEDVIDALAERVDAEGRLSPPVHLVFGNVDWDAPALGRYARELGIEVDDPMGLLERNGRTVAFTHGDQPALMREALEQGADYLCHGHSHRRRDERVGRTRVINPGALFRAAEHTVALLETDSDRLSFIRVPRDDQAGS